MSHTSLSSELPTPPTKKPSNLLTLTLRPASLSWLLWHEIRLFFYEMSGQKSNAKQKRGMPVSMKIIMAFVLIFMHFLAWVILRKLPTLADQPAPAILIATGLAMFAVFSLMLSLALNRSVNALFQRGDLDLLLSSPISSKVIFRVKLAAVVFGVSATALFFLAPFAHVGLVLGQARWLGIYPTILSMAVIAASIAMLMTLGLVKILGIRRTLVVAQLLGALTGATMFLLSQLFGNSGKSFQQKILANVRPLFEDGAALGGDSVLWLPAKALFGAPIELALFTALAFAAFYATSKFTHQFFVRGVQQSSGMAKSQALASAKIANTSVTNQTAKAKNHLFAQGLARNVLLKEWRLIRRDPQLISHVLLQLLYLCPAMFLIFNGKAMLPGMAAGMIILSSSLVGSLIWIIVMAEDAADLIHSAPVKQKQIQSIKLIAAILPVLLLILPVLLWVMLSAPGLALLTLFSAIASMLCVSLINLWLNKPQPRAQFNRRANGNFAAGLLEQVNHFSWAGFVYVTSVFGWWGVIPFTIAISSLLLAWCFRDHSKY
jgi:ABC-2 type transport system permease protein